MDTSPQSGWHWARHLIGSSSWAIAERFARLAAALVVGSLVARHLGPAAFGEIGYHLSLFALLAPLLSLGIDQPAMRALVGGRPAEIIGTALVLRMMASAIVLFPACLILLACRESAVGGNIAVPLALATLLQSADAMEWPFLITGRTRNPSLVRLATIIVSASLRICLIASGAGIQAFAWMVTLDAAMIAAGLTLLSLRTHGVRLQAPWSAARELLRQGFPLALSTALVSAYMKVDQLMVMHLAGREAAGAYAAAVRIAESWWFIPTTIAAVAIGQLSQAREQSLRAGLSEAHRLFRLMTLISLPTCLSMCLAAGWIIAVLYGPNFSAAHVPLAILAWCGIPVALGVARSSWLTAERAWGFQLTAGAIGLIANFILNLLFIPLWGAAGAAVATLISYVIIVIPVSLLLRDGGRTCSAMIKGLLLIPVPRTGR